MTIKEIIYSLECQAQDKDRLAGGDPNSDLTKDATALYEAIRMLRAKLYRIRWEECPDCCLWGRKRFCPECGRPLTEEAWTEMERRIGGKRWND